MSLNAIDLIAAVRARLTTSCGADASGVYVNRAPARVKPTPGVKPYIIIMVGGTPLDTFTSNGIVRAVTVWIVGNAEDGLGPVATLWDKVYGDSDPVTSGPPTVGLHRWTPTFTTNNQPTVMVYTGDDPMYDEDPNAFGHVLRFEITIDYAAPTPP